MFRTQAFGGVTAPRGEVALHSTALSPTLGDNHSPYGLYAHPQGRTAVRPYTARRLASITR